jgi:hypothetical protein
MEHGTEIDFTFFDSVDWKSFNERPISELKEKKEKP